MSDSIRVGSLGGRSRDVVLDETTAIDLIDFATNDGRYSVELIHLHGRATEDSDLVITERDYQLLYVRDSSRQSAFREGLDIAFGGNPVLFVGLGLSEDDILRPLREFVSGTSRRNRAIIALRDATAEHTKREAFTMDAFAKYGAHVIHFGFRTDEAGFHLEKRPPQKGGEKRDQSWLHRLLRIIDDFENDVELMSSRDKTAGSDAREVFDCERPFEKALRDERRSIRKGRVGRGLFGWRTSEHPVRDRSVGVAVHADARTVD